MNIEKEIFNVVFNEDFFSKCNIKIENKNWKNIFEKLFVENMNYYKKVLKEPQYKKMLNEIKKYYDNVNEIRNENQLLYEFLKSIPNIKFLLKTRIKSVNSIFEKKLKMQEDTRIYDIDAVTIILTEYNGENILKLNDGEQLKAYNYVINKIDSFYSKLNFYSAEYGNNYVKNPKIGKIINMNVMKKYLFDLNSNEIPRYFSLHKCYQNIFKDRIKEIHVNTLETEKAIKGNTTLNHYIYKPFKSDVFLIFFVPNHLDIYDDCIYDYNLVESFDYNFYNKICFDKYLMSINM